MELKKKEYLALKLYWGKETILKKIINYPLRLLSYFKKNIFYLFSFLVNERKYTINLYQKNNIDKKILEYVEKINPDLGYTFALGENHGFIGLLGLVINLILKLFKLLEIGMVQVQKHFNSKSSFFSSLI